MNTQQVARMYELLGDQEQTLIAQLISRLLPDDIATPDDLAAIAKSRVEYERGDVVRMEDIDWS
ncbi:MAG: hypothetical protein FWD25_08250 [Clostridia bacterium]|nr:hypothetical protein [Clostridia bacterium]